MRIIALGFDSVKEIFLIFQFCEIFALTAWSQLADFPLLF